MSSWLSARSLAAWLMRSSLTKSVGVLPRCFRKDLHKWPEERPARCRRRATPARKFFRAPHRHAKLGEPAGNLRLAEHVGGIEEEPSEEFAKQDLELGLAEGGRGRGVVELEQLAVEGAARGGIEAKARREDRRRELLEEGVVLQVHAQAQKDVEPEVEHHDLARLRLRVGREAVQVVRPQEADAAGFEVLPLAVHAMLQPPSGHEEDFREVVRVQHRPRLRHAVEVEVAARLEVFEAPPRRST